MLQAFWHQAEHIQGTQGGTREHRRKKLPNDAVGSLSRPSFDAVAGGLLAPG